MALVKDRFSRLVVFSIAAVIWPGLFSFVSAQSTVAGATVEIRSVQFNSARPPNGGDAWLEAVVELNIFTAGDSGAYARFADRVRISLSLSVRKRGDGFEFFRSSAEAVSLEAGRAAVRFYLPPEIVAREQISSDPFAYLVEVALGGRPVGGDGGALASSVLSSPEVLRNFKDRVAQAAPLNDGILVPQYDSPFAASYGGDTPSYVRRSR